MRCALLHGFAGSASGWDQVIASWRAGAVPDAITLPGHGGAPVALTWEANLDAIGTMVEGADVLIGYSLGARVALGLVATGRCQRAILIGVNPGIDDADRPARRASDAAWATLIRTRGVEMFADAWLAQPIFASQARFTARRTERRHRRLLLDAEQLARSLEVMGLAEMPDYRGAVAEHADKITLVAGANDSKFIAIARQLPARLVTLPGCGHDPTLEQPAALARALADLLGLRPRTVTRTPSP